MARSRTPEHRIAQAREQIQEAIREMARDDVHHQQLMGEELRVLHEAYLGNAMRLDQLIKSRTHFEEGQLADLGFLFREDTNLLDDWRKDCKARQELIGKLIAHQRITAAESSPESADDIVRGELATAKVKSEIQPKLPRRGTPEYFLVCEHFGLSKEVAEGGIVKIDWNEARKYVTRLVEDGETPPAGLSDTYPHFSCVYRRRRSK